MTKRMPPVRTEAEIAELARDMLAGTVYALEDVPQSIIPLVFMPLALGNPFKGYSKPQLERLFIFSVLGKDASAPRAVNGYPMFVAMQVWRRRDAIKAAERAKEAEKMLNLQTSVRPGVLH